MEDRLARIEKQLDEVLSLLNGPNGLVTRIELHEQRIGNIPNPASLKWYAGFGGGVTVVFGAIGFFILRLMK